MKKRSFLLVFTICAILLLSCSGVMAAGATLQSSPQGDAIGTVTVSVEKFTLGQGYLLEPVIVPLYENETAADVIVRVMGKENCNYNSVGFYLRSIKDEDTSTPDFPQYILKEVANRTDDTEESLLATGRVNEGWLGEFDYYNTSGWIYWVNHTHANVGADQWLMKDGDVMRWQFTVVALGGDLGDTGYDNLIDSANKDALTEKIAEINRDKNAYLNGDATKQRYYDNAMKILSTMTATQEQVDMALANLNGTSTEEPTLPDPDALDEEVENVESLIAAIGDVTKDSGAAIEAATAAYDALPTRKQGRVHNYNVLKRAITNYEKILAEAEKPVDPVKPVDPPAAQYPGADTMKDMTNKAAWYYNAVDWAMKVGFFGGDDKGNFNPDQYITRAEFARMLYNYYKDDATVMKDGTAPKFNDVKGDDWYYRAVKACAKAGIFKGDDKGNFNPNAPITRQDTALVLMRIFIGEDAIAAVDVDERLAELKAEGKDLADFRQTADYAQKAMAAAIGLIFNGDDKGMLHPTNNITRAETATVLQNYFQ